MEKSSECKIWKALYLLLLEKYKILLDSYPASTMEQSFVLLKEAEGTVKQIEFLAKDKETSTLTDRIEDELHEGKVKLKSMESFLNDLRAVLEKMESEETYH